ncbi:hypothetical protein P3S68_027915 [Capsicum galapagoense]
MNHHLTCPFTSLYIHHSPPYQIHKLQYFQAAPMEQENNQVPYLVYASTIPSPLYPPQAWLEVALTGQALTFTIQVNGRDYLVMIQNPRDLAHIITEGMTLGTEVFNSTTQQNPALPFYPQLQEELVPWIQPHVTVLQMEPEICHDPQPPLSPHQAQEGSDGNRLAITIEDLAVGMEETASVTTFLGQVPDA